MIDDAALIAALANNALGGAGLDVYENEPNVRPALLNDDGVLTPPGQAASAR